MKFRHLAAGLAAIALLIAAPVLAAGLFPGLPPVMPAGTTTPQTVNGSSIGLGYTVFPLTGNELIPADTGLASGGIPQTEVITPKQLSLYSAPAVALTDIPTIALDASQSELYTVTLAGNRILANPTNLQSGQVFRLQVKQDATGSRTLSYQATAGIFTWPGGTAPTLSTGANAVDLLTFVYDGTKLRGTSSLNFQ